MKTDLLVYSGSIAAISAALAAKAKGRDVVLFTHRNFLGEDICDSLRLALPDELDLSEPLARRLYGEAAEKGELLRPMHIKRELDRVLAEADIPVLLGAAPARFLHEENQPCTGLRVHNRSGDVDLEFNQILDGSLQGDLFRMAGIPLSEPWSDVHVIRRVIGGDTSNPEEWVSEGDVEFPHGDTTLRAPLWAHRSKVQLEDTSWAAWMKLEQENRLKAYRPGQEMSADGIFALTGEHLLPEENVTEANGDFRQVPASAVSALDGKLWLTGPLAHVDETTREKLIRHDHAIAFGQHIVSLLPEKISNAKLKSSTSSIEVDVLVVGGGTGGAPAAIAAARSGKKTLVVEYLSGLGGVGTLGLIGKYWFGNRVGFTAEVDQGAREKTTKEFSAGSWDVEAKMQWYHEEITNAGGAIWYKTMLCRALTEGNRVIGAVLCTPRGEVEVRANCVVDASGAAEVAFSAGADTVSIGQGHLAVQGTGLPGRNPGANYTNTDYDFVDDSNAKDIGSAHVTAREKFKNAFDAGQHLDSRERRRVVGDYEITPMDIRLTRVFPDSLIKAKSNFDTHGFTIHPLFMVVPPDHDEQQAFIPLRALLPKGLDGILVTGLGISAHRDAMPVIRMQADVQNQGYAAGIIAAMATDGRVRELDILDIQEQLVAKGILDPEIKGAKDSFPLSDADIDEALAASVDDANYIDRIFTLPEAERMQKLINAFTSAESEKAKQHFAFVLGILGNNQGFDTLLKGVSESSWDEGWNYTGMGQFGQSMSTLDAHIIALSRCKNSEALPVLQEKAGTLPSDGAFSHYRVLAEALETIGDPKGASVLNLLLQKPGIIGHHLHDTADRLKTATDNTQETEFRNRALIELHLATGLYRLDCKNKTAKLVLENYAEDLRGLFAAHAKRCLKN